MIEIVKIMKGLDNISVEVFFGRIDIDRTRGHILKIMMRLWTVIRHGSSCHRVVYAWNGHSGKIMAAKRIDRFKLELNRYLDALEIEQCRDIDKTWLWVDAGI